MTIDTPDYSLANAFDRESVFMRRSILFIQIAVLIHVLRSVVGRLFSILLSNYFEPRFWANDYLLFFESISVFVFGLICIGMWRIVYAMRAKIHFIFSTLTVLLFGYLFFLKGLVLWRHIIIILGKGYTLSKILPIAMLLIPPVGILSGMMVALAVQEHFHFSKKFKTTIYWLTATIGTVWMLGIFLSFILWWQNSDQIDFSLRWLVIRNYCWQSKLSLYTYFAWSYGILLWLWQIVLFIFLRNVKKALVNNR